MVVVMTSVQLREGHVDAVRDLFASTNPGLVADQDDWIAAKFTADRASDRVTVLAFWRNAAAYRDFAASDEFRVVMERFASHFASPPEVVVHEILFEM